MTEEIQEEEVIKVLMKNEDGIFEEKDLV